MGALPVLIGRLTLHPRRELLDGAGQAIALGGRALDILSLLAARGGVLVHKNEILAEVWSGALVEDNALQAQISAVRRALGPEAARLVTVHGRGYRLRLDAAPTAGPADPASVAVLAFDNLTGDPAQEYLASGLAEELIGTLSRVPGLKVPARTSSFAYRGKAVDVRTIGRELGVATVLEGSIRAGGARLRVTAQLIDAVSGFHQWSANFDRPMADLIELQDELASAIAGALQRELVPMARRPADAEAMRLVLHARALSRGQTRESLAAAADAARQAIALDPGFAKAWESLAGTRWVEVSLGFVDGAALAEARDHALRACELDPSLGGPEAILAAIDATQGRLSDAFDRFSRAATLDPANPLVGESQALLALLPAGRAIAAGASVQASIALAAARPQPYVVQGLCEVMAGNVARAAAAIETALLLGHRRSPMLEYVCLEVALASGNRDDVAAALTGIFMGEAGPAGMLADALIEGTDREAAGAAFARFFEQADESGMLWRQSITAGAAIRCLAALDRFDAAFAAAERIAVRWRTSGRLPTAAMSVLWAPALAGFRADPRFAALAAALDLPAFWVRHGPPDGYRLDATMLDARPPATSLGVQDDAGYRASHEIDRHAPP